MKSTTSAWTHSAEKIIGKALEVNADLIGMSALLTTTMVRQREVIEELDKEGLRPRIKVMVGGAPITQDWVEKIKADGYSEDAIGAVKTRQAIGRQRIEILEVESARHCAKHMRSIKGLDCLALYRALRVRSTDRRLGDTMSKNIKSISNPKLKLGSPDTGRSKENPRSDLVDHRKSRRAFPIQARAGDLGSQRRRRWIMKRRSCASSRRSDRRCTVKTVSAGL